MLRKLLSNQYFLLFFIIMISLWLYKDTLNAYFFQDDWFSFRISQAAGLNDFIGFFLPKQDVIYYRPLGMQLPFFVMGKLFPGNSFPFHAFSFLVHVLNTVLVYFATFLLVKKISVSLTAAFLFATSAMHFIPMVWFSTISFQLGFLLYILAFTVFIMWISTNKPAFLFLFLVLEFLGLMTNELNFVLPITVFLYGFLNKKLNRSFWLSLILPLLYVFLRILYIPSFTDTYAIELSKNTAKAFFVYLMWLFNWPEEIRNQLDNILRLNFSFITYFWWLTGISSIVTISFSYYIITNFRKADSKLMTFFTANAVAGLIFPLLFPNHTYPYYLMISGWSLFSMLALSVLGKPSVNLLLCLIWLTGSFYALNFNFLQHWAVKRSVISRAIATDVLRRFPILTSGKSVYVNNDAYLKVVLSRGEMFKILYNDKEAETVYYDHEDTIWKNIPETEDMWRKRLDLIYVK